MSTRLLVLLIVAAVPWAVAGEAVAGKSPEQALRLLVAGNQRFVAQKPIHPDQDARRLKEVAAGQHPFAVVLGCSDSRVPPELLFDQGLGDLFVIRVAGESPDDAVLGSIEYAVEHLGVTLVVVLGHEKCGAVQAATSAEPPPGHITSLLDPIKPAVAEARKQPGDLVHNAMLAHVRHIVHQLAHSEPILKESVEKRKLRVLGADYDVNTGGVFFLGGPLD